MKKAVLIAAGAIAVAAAGWSAFWFAGKSEIENRVDAEIARLTAAGYEISYLEGSVGGYPHAYLARYEAVRIADPEGRVLTLPWIEARAGLEAPGRVAFHFPETFSGEMPLPPAMMPAPLPAVEDANGEAADEGENASDEEAADAAEDPVEPAEPIIVKVDVEADGLVIETGGADGAATTVDAVAKSLLIVSGAADQPVSAGVEILNLDSAFTVPNTPEVGRASGRAAMDRIDYTISTLDPSGQRTTIEGISDRLGIAGSSTLVSEEAWQRFVAGETEGAEAEFSYQAGQTESSIHVQDSPDGLDGIFRQTAGTTGGLIRVAGGAVEMRASAENNSLELTPAEPDAPIRGTIGLDSIETVYIAPIAPSDEMSDFTVRIAWQGLEIAESLWSMVDPDALLPRDPAHMIVEVTGTGRMVAVPEGEPLPVGQDAIELGNVEIAVVDIAALGATLEADGAIEFIQPLNLPQGAIAVRMTGALDLAGQLQALGVISPEQFEFATLMSTVYTAEGENDGERTTEIVFSADGVTVNGLPVR